jgi:uroporphyrinogen-III decarboxylase
VRSIEEREDGEILTWTDGTQTWLPWDDNAQYEPANLGRPPRPTFDAFDPDTDFDRLDEWPGYTWGVYHAPYIAGKAPGLLLDIPDYFFRTIDMVKAAVGDAVSVHGEVFSPFTHYMELFNYEEALIGLLNDPGKAIEILRGLSGATIAWANAQASRGVDAILVSSAFAGSGFISPRMYAKFVVPFERMVADAVHAAYPSLPVYTHTCGMLNDRLELLVESHVDGIDTLDPPPLGNTELADAKARIGKTLFIKGNMNSVAILTDSEEQFRDRAIRTLSTGKPGGGYILSTACSVAPHVEPWKLEMLADIADEYGQYG